MDMWTHRQLALILAAALAGPALAADNSAWTNLSMLKPGTRIGIIQSDMKRVEGLFEGFTESGIIVRTDRDVTLRKEEVVRVYRRPRVNRPIRAAVGAAIGAAGGAILSSTAGTRFRNEGQDISDAAFIGGGVGIGAAIGALSGGGYHTVYQR
jgi:hypothetical protein